MKCWFCVAAAVAPATFVDSRLIGTIRNSNGSVTHRMPAVGLPLLPDTSRGVTPSAVRNLGGFAFYKVQGLADGWAA